MVTTLPPTPRQRARALLAIVVSTRTAALPADLALLAARTALAWIFIYYGAGKLFGSFNGPGFHRTALYFSNTAHLHPGGFFAVLGGVVELGGGIALALGLASRLAGLALFGDMVMAMITVTWATGINSKTSPPGYQLNLAIGVLALVVAALGGGRFSLDTLIERRLMAMEARPSPSPAAFLDNRGVQGSTSSPSGSASGRLPTRATVSTLPLSSAQSDRNRSEAEWNDQSHFDDAS
jgi:putative oxidoreductase